MAGRRRPAAEIPESVAKPDWSDLLDNMLNVEGSLGDTYRRFYQYSTSNCAFLLMQGCPVEPIATFKGWQSVGRTVAKGARAFYIQRPILVKTGEIDQETGEEKKIQRFKPVKSIFPIGMTEGEALPDMELPEWSKERALGALGIREVAFQEFDGNMAGYSVAREVAINPAGPHPEKTLTHELGHIILGHTTTDAHEDYLKHRGIREFEAEATAHIVTTELGIITPEMASVSRGYLQSWLSGEKPDDSSIRAVFKAADAILVAGREPVDEAGADGSAA